MSLDVGTFCPCCHNSLSDQNITYNAKSRIALLTRMRQRVNVWAPICKALKASKGWGNFWWTVL